MRLWQAGIFSGGPNAFFTLLREQIVVYEKKKARDKMLSKTKKVDKDLRTIFQPDSGSDKSETPPQTPEPAPEPTRRQRYRLRR
jgi:hypothetical protein